MQVGDGDGLFRWSWVASPPGAVVACRQLGFDYGEPEYWNDNPYYNTFHALVTNVTCNVSGLLGWLRALPVHSAHVY